MLDVELQVPTEDQMLDLDWIDLEQCLRKMAAQFHGLRPPDLSRTLVRVPSWQDAEQRRGMEFYNAAILGILRWQNEAILRDLEELKKQENCAGVVTAFVAGERLPEPPKAQPPSEVDRYVVCDADFSQEQVIWQARHGPGLVVHGPPGTGKSQTIVNVIADTLAQGQTILMVCQKQAATRIVLDRLRAAGLDELCLEVHDPESDRLGVFRTIRNQAATLARTSEEVEYLNRRRSLLAGQVTGLERVLDRHARALNEPHPRIGLSYKAMKAMEGALCAAFATVRTLPALQEIVRGLSEQEVQDICDQVETVGCWFAQCDALGNPWRNRQSSLQMSASLKHDVAVVTAELRLLDGQHMEAVHTHGAGMPLPEDTEAFAATASALLEQLRPITRQPGGAQERLLTACVVAIRAADHAERSRRLDLCRTAAALAEKVEGAPLAPSLRELWRSLPAERVADLGRCAATCLRNRCRWWRIANPLFHVAARVLRRACPDAEGSGLWHAAEVALAYANALKLRQDLGAATQRLVPGIRLRAEEDRVLVSFARTALRTMQTAVWLCQQEAEHPWVGEVVDMAVDAQNAPALPACLEKIDGTRQRAQPAGALLAALDGLGLYLKGEALTAPREAVRAGKSNVNWLNALNAGLENLEVLVALDADRGQRRGAAKRVLEALEDYEANRYAGAKVPGPPPNLNVSEYGQWWAALVRYSAALAWQNQCCTENPELVTITPEVHAERVKALETALAKKRDLEGPVLIETWRQRQFEHRSAPWQRIFQLRRSKYGDAKRLREAIELSLGEGLLAMRPCWLVNPAAAAQLFPLVSGLFDLVIFDEASQCTIEQAVPAIFRGKRLLVTGDEKQLPPTSFFLARWENETAEPDEVGDEAPADETPVAEHERRMRNQGTEFLLQVEELLDAAVANLPERYLLVHYRSRHPALIRFSNHAFYDGRLEAPPATCQAPEGYPPILYYNVAGTYADRRNRTEAQKVVSILREFWLRSDKSPTVGVVSFNQPQRDLIEDLLEEAARQDDDFARRYSEELSRRDGNLDVGFFVKNLENVQGDERDVMIFSTTFGRDAEGRFYRRFGPVGALGGERRLNVAITRAKHQVIVVTSMPTEEVSSALSSDDGLGTGLTPSGYLQLYLEYARAVFLNNPDAEGSVLQRLRTGSRPAHGGEPESPLESDVYEFLSRAGYETHCQVGESGFRIDLAVLHPEPHRGYVLGIECDGATYHSARSARARDVWREQILHDRGWRLYRIWSTRWWYDHAGEQAKLVHAIQDAVGHGHRPRRPSV
jgi:primosomal replication protein N''